MTDAPRNRPLAPGRHARRPLLLALVYGVFLMVIGGMAVALAVLVSALFSAAALSTTVSHDRALVRVWADANITSADLDPGLQRTGRVTELEGQLAALVERGEILHLEVRLPDGTVLLSDKNGLRGRRAHASTAFTSAAAGDPAAWLLAAEIAAEAVGLASTGPLLREYLPSSRPTATLPRWSGSGATPLSSWGGWKRRMVTCSWSPQSEAWCNETL